MERMEPVNNPASQMPNLPVAPRPSRTEVVHACQLTEDWLLERQDATGFWCAELEGDSLLASETIMLLRWLGDTEAGLQRRLANRLLAEQLPTGGWGLFPGSGPDVSLSVKAYFALKLMGEPAESPDMSRARLTILRLGGAEQVNSFTRYFLALLGQIDFTACPAVPPEMMLLPNWAPINIYRVSAWSRTILVPLSIVWAHRPSRSVLPSEGIEELFTTPPRQWKMTCPPGLSSDWGAKAWRYFFLHIDTTVKRFESLGWKPLRRVAVQRAERWVLDRFRDSDGLGAIYPPIVWSWVALKCLGYADDAPEIMECRRHLVDLVIDDADGTRLQPCKSPVWDTAITLRSLGPSSSRSGGMAAEFPPSDGTGEKITAARERAIQWLLDREVKEAGDWSRRVDASPAGWFFEHRNLFYPDTDDTAMVLLALRDEVTNAGDADGPTDGTTQWSASRRAPDTSSAMAMAHRIDRLVAASQRASDWLLAMQNRDGGWGAFDRDNDAKFLCHVPFADHNAMIDPSTPDLTARVVEALAAWGVARDTPPMRRAVDYLYRTQEPDGSWFGRWGVNYIYGTWQVLVGLRAAGVPMTDRAVQQGARWLLHHQTTSGGWGESAHSYADRKHAGHGPPTPSQTAWALLGLIAAGHGDTAGVCRGIRWLLDQQCPDGSWEETEFTGTGFPLVFYLRYHYYRIYFPLMALRQWQAIASEAT